MALSLSICIPTYNRATLLRATLMRLAEIPALVREVVVTDNASTDDTASVVAELTPRFPRMVYHRHAENVGMLLNFQAALALGSSDLLFPLSDDDALLPERIADAVALLEADPECVAVYGGYERVDASHGAPHHLAVPRHAGRFTLADLDTIAQTADILTVPLVRRETFQRHCYFDATTFGFMRLIAQLLRHGAIRIVDHPIYRHAGDSPNSTENRIAEPWYQDFMRGDWEQFAAASPGAGNFATLAHFTASHVLHGYLLGHFAARTYNQPMAERNYLVRYLVYAADFPESHARQRIDDWEQNRLLIAALDRVRGRLRAHPGLTRVVIEQGPVNLPALGPRIVADLAAPDGAPVATLALDPTAFVGHARQPGDFLLAERWAALAARAEATADQLAMLDIVATLRLPGTRNVALLNGPDGTTHLCT